MDPLVQFFPETVKNCMFCTAMCEFANPFSDGRAEISAYNPGRVSVSLTSHAGFYFSDLEENIPHRSALSHIFPVKA